MLIELRFIYSKPSHKSICPLFSIHIEDSFFFPTLYYAPYLLKCKKPTKLLSLVGLMFANPSGLNPNYKVGIMAWRPVHGPILAPQNSVFHLRSTL
jgi:hypothetical protein